MSLENQTSTESKPAQKVSLNIIGSNAAYEDSEIRDLVEYVEKNWKSFLLTICAVFAAFYLVKVFRDTRNASLEASADLLNKVRQSYEALADTELAPPPKEEKERTEKEEQKKKLKSQLNEQLKALAETKEPYPTFGMVYKALSLSLDGNRDELKNQVEALNLDKILQTDDTSRMPLELSALVFARALIDWDDMLGKGSEMLTKLAEKGKYVHVTSALVLSRIADTKEKKAEALATLEKVLASHPEQNALLTPEIERLRS